MSRVQSAACPVRGPCRATAPAAGFALLEALIAILILSFAILGLIAYQSQAISAASESGTRVQASLLAQSLLDQINLNRNDAGCFLVTSGQVAPGACTTPQAIEATRQWVQAAQERLPQATEPGLQPQVELRPAPGAGAGQQIVITLRWRLPKSDATRNFTVASQLWPSALKY